MGHIDGQEEERIVIMQIMEIVSFPEPHRKARGLETLLFEICSAINAGKVCTKRAGKQSCVG